MKPIDMVTNSKDTILNPSTSSSVASEVRPEAQYEKLRFYLSYDSRENKFLCPKHAPIEKIKRTQVYVVLFFVINLLITIFTGLVMV